MPRTPLDRVVHTERTQTLGWLTHVDYVGVCSAVLPSVQLSPVQIIILLLQFAHFLDFIKVHHEACLQVVQVFDALTAEDRGVLTAVEVLDALLMLLTHVGSEVPLIGLIIVVQIRVSLEALLEVNPGE